MSLEQIDKELREIAREPGRDVMALSWRKVREHCIAVGMDPERPGCGLQQVLDFISELKGRRT